MSRMVRQLSDEERILWSQVARTTKPLKGKVAEHQALPVSLQNRDELSPQLQAAPTPAKPPAAIDRLQLQHLDKETRIKLGKGRLQIGGRIDLHGMSQAEAHLLLHAFLRRASERGLRYVLVITGKGFSSGGDGVLRRAVPGWLATAGFRELVSGYEQADRSHGGEGALYVRLRRREPQR